MRTDAKAEEAKNYAEEDVALILEEVMTYENANKVDDQTDA